MLKRFLAGATVVAGLSVAGSALADTLTVTFSPAAPPAPVPFGPWALAAIAAALMTVGLAVLKRRQARGLTTALTLALAGLVGLGGMAVTRPARAAPPVEYTLTTSPSVFTINAAGPQTIINGSGHAITVDDIQITGGSNYHVVFNTCMDGTVLEDGDSCSILVAQPV